MIYWKGKRYHITKSNYNGEILGYLLDGLVLPTRPAHTKVSGHITTEDGVLILLHRDMRQFVVILIILLSVVMCFLWPRKHYVYYQVTFAEQPLYNDGILYCNVVNEAEMEVTVQFYNAENKSSPYPLLPGETLPYIPLDFVPTHIRYNGKSDFLLEVQYD